jgi:PAS domain S-box-containing protein
MLASIGLLCRPQNRHPILTGTVLSVITLNAASLLICDLPLAPQGGLIFISSLSAILSLSFLLRTLGERFLSLEQTKVKETQDQIETSIVEFSRLSSECRPFEERAHVAEESLIRATLEAEEKRGIAEKISQYLLDAQRMGRIGHWISDDVNQIVTWSPQVFEIAGLPPQAVIPMNIPRKIVHPDDLAKYLQARARAIETRTGSRVELRWVRPDGEIRCVQLNINARFDSSERCVGLFGTTQDITELKVKEAQLRGVIDQLDRVQRIAGIGHTIEDLSTGQYTWSQGAAAIFGVDPASTEPTPEYMRQFYHPDDRTKVIEMATAARLQGIAAPPLEYRIVRPDGAVRMVYRENEVENDASGRPARRIVTFKDITDLKAAEAQLRETMEHLTRVQRIAGIGSIEVDLVTGLVTWSPGACTIFGVESDAIEPTPEYILNLVHPDDRAKVAEVAAQSRALGVAAAPLEYRIIRPDGATRIVYREYGLQLNEEGRPIRRTMTFKDITELKAVEVQLRDAKDAAEAASVAKSQFLANMSHELRTPLNGVIGFSEMIKLALKGPLPPVYQEYGRLIHQSGEHLHAVINDILDLAKVDAGKFELRREDGVDPRQIAEACVSLVRGHADIGEIKLSLSLAAGDLLPALVADPTRLKQILLNLLSNAIKFTRPGGSVRLAVRRSDDGGVAFEVRDTGAGMTPSEIEVALEPFGQVRDDTLSTHEGTGLGLPLARRLAELHGGSLVIDSEKGCGTTVTVTLLAPPGDNVATDRSVAAAA